MLKGQAERLMPMLEEIMSEADYVWSDLDMIVVGTGPGNFTGVRISVASARSLALALEIPAIGVSMFEALACDTRGTVAVLLDARRERVFWQLFRDGKSISEPLQSELASLSADYFSEDTVLYGRAAKDLGERHGLPHGQLQAFHPLALAIVAQTKQPGKRPSPLYLRAADAALPSDPPPMILDDA